MEAASYYPPVYTFRHIPLFVCLRSIGFFFYFQVKQGAENMIQSLTSGHSRDKKLLQEAQQMLADSRVKIEFLKLRILKIRQNKQLRQQQGTGAGDTPSNGDTYQVKGEWN
jgi:protein kinase N